MEKQLVGLSVLVMAIDEGACSDRLSEPAPDFGIGYSAPVEAEMAYEETQAAGTLRMDRQERQ